jgi:hypothetical protein
MTFTSRLALVVTFAATGIGSPAFAHSASQNIRQSTHDAIAGRQSGLNAFAMVSRSPYDPALTGGGSLGYNENLRRDQW